MDRMRTSLFSILGPLDGLSFLDLFSGSGLVGLEAASRGATPVDLVEKDFGKKAVIGRNLAWVEDDVKLHLADVRMFLKRAARKWDVIYADPPFPMAGKLEVLQLVAAKELLVSGGSLLMHYPGEESFPETVGELVQYDHREYGRSHVIFYTWPEGSASNPTPEASPGV
jgi:16S rRNA (guanine(966)-N(2))-methyltransferase RsmD